MPVFLHICCISCCAHITEKMKQRLLLLVACAMATSYLPQCEAFFLSRRRCRSDPATERCGFFGWSVVQHDGVPGTDTCERFCVYFESSAYDCGGCDGGDVGTGEITPVPARSPVPLPTTDTPAPSSMPIVAVPVITPAPFPSPITIDSPPLSVPVQAPSSVPVPVQISAPTAPPRFK